MNKKPTFVDLFAGIGGFRLGFENAGCQCVFSCEIDSYATKTYAANFGEISANDITKIDPNEIPDHDILTAGFPCQPFSVAGVSKNNALGRLHGFEHATQGTLFFDIAKIIESKNPRAFVLENVKNLKSHDKGRTFQTILWTLQNELGYTVYNAVLDARYVLPQHRERIFIVGFREPRSFQFPSFEKSNHQAVKNILEKNVDERYTLTDHLWTYLQGYANKHRLKGNGFGYSLVEFDGITRTLSARYYKDGSEILIPQNNKNPRRLTPRECARLMGFPEEYKIVCSDTRAYKQFGNSVAVPLVEMIAHQLLLALRRDPLPRVHRKKTALQIELPV